MCDWFENFMAQIRARMPFDPQFDHGADFVDSVSCKRSSTRYNATKYYYPSTTDKIL